MFTTGPFTATSGVGEAKATNVGVSAKKNANSPTRALITRLPGIRDSCRSYYLLTPACRSAFAPWAPFAVYSSQVATSRCGFVDNRAARALAAGSLEARRISAARTAGIVRSVSHAL